jgi:hypothetical protein
MSDWSWLPIKSKISFDSQVVIVYNIHLLYIERQAVMSIVINVCVYTILVVVTIVAILNHVSIVV